MTETALRCVGIDDALLDFGQHFNGFFHVLGIAHRNGAGVVDHQHGNRAHLDGITGHCHNGCSRCRNRIDFDRDAALVVLKHGIDLGSGEHIPARRVVHQNADAEQLPHVKAQLLGADAGKPIVDDLVVVRLVVGRDLAGNKELVLLQQTLDCDTGVLVMLKDVGHNGIRNLVTNLVGMTITDLLTGNNLTHVLCPPSFMYHKAGRLCPCPQIGSHKDCLPCSNIAFTV